MQQTDPKTIQMAMVSMIMATVIMEIEIMIK